MTYIEAPYWLRYIIQSLFVFEAMFATFVFVVSIIHHKKMKRNLFFLSSIITTQYVVVVYGYIEITPHKVFIGKYISRLPIVVVGLGAVVWFLVLLIFALRLRSYIRDNITAQSYKQAIDQLPVALCVYNKDGVIQVLNHAMEELLDEILQGYIMNGHVIWDEFMTGPRAMTGSIGNAYGIHMIRRDDGTVWSCENKTNADGITQITVMNITEEYNLGHELADNNKKLQSINEKLKAYGAIADEAVRQEEFLETKIRIHDNMGNILVSVMSGLVNDTDISDELVENWKNVLNLMNTETEKEESLSVKELDNLAKFLDIEIHLEGELPKKKREQHLLMSGARECVTNAIRHAGAKNLYISIIQGDGYKEIRYTNDGQQPEDDIDMGGGLSGLQKLAEHEHCELRLEYEPAYTVVITILGEEDDNGV